MPFSDLDHLARPILLEQAHHAAASWPAIDVYCQRGSAGIVARFDKPEESVDRVILLASRECKRREVDISSVLLLCRENGGTGANGRRLEGDGNISING